MALPYRKLHATQAVSYFKGRDKKANATPAILWLFLALVGIVVLRNRALPSTGQAITLAIMAGIVVAAGLVLPELITVLLAGLLIAGVLDVPGVGPFFTAVQGRISQLTGQA
jgi:predicted lysophospholipase L1 biosynthesis ABC-type transport system permease subunit